MLRIGQAQATVEIDGVAFGLLAAHHSVPGRRLRELVDQLVRRVEGGGGRLRDIGDAPAPQLALLGLAQFCKIDAVEHDGAGLDAAAGPGVAQRGKADGRLAGAGFANEAEDFAAPEREINTLDDLVPDLVALALDTEAANF